MFQTEHCELSLKDLSVRIVHNADREALWELHQRPFLAIADGRYVTLGEYVEILRESAHDMGWWRYAGTEVVDRACDVLLDRFRNIPIDKPGHADPPGKETVGPDPRGPDCRNYFRAFLDCVAEEFERCPPVTELEAEVRAGRLLQRFVRRHFYLCIKESLREANPLMSRYTWKVNGYTFILWFPKSFEGRQRGKWLEQHVANPPALGPRDRSRIQALIDEHFGVLRLVSLDADDHESHIPGGPTLGAPRIEGGISGKNTRERIAAEKVQTIDQQMPAIRALGPERLNALVLAVLENLVSRQETDKEIAKRWGLSFATFSRFAGRGGRGKKKREHLPALFMNIAHYMATIPHFVAVAKDEGVLDKARRMAALGGLPRTGGETDAS